MYFGHIGDSRIYHLPGGVDEIRQVSKDDTHVGWLHRTGRLTERESKSHPRRTSLQKALGAGHQFVEPQVGAVAFEPGDLCLLCTDGLVESLFDRHLLQLLRHPEPVEAVLSPAHRLVTAALERPGRDNSTAVVIEGL